MHTCYMHAGIEAQQEKHTTMWPTVAAFYVFYALIAWWIYFLLASSSYTKDTNVILR